MGIVFKQSLNNTLVTYIGFGIGAINQLFLYTQFLEAEYFGLVTVMFSASLILMPLMTFGVQNTLVKYYSSFKEEQELNAFLTLMLLLPIVIVLPLAGVAYFANETIGDFLSSTNPIVKNYVWYIFLIGFSLAYFEIFYAWARVRLKSVFGNFMKEIFTRVGTMILLVLIYLDVISVDFFLKAMVGVNLLRVFVMKLYAYKLQMPKIDFKWPENTREILSYSTLIVLGGSAAIILLEIDKVMLNQYISIENVAYYGIATYIAMVIIVPSRSMHQITYPLTAELINSGNMIGLKTLYQKSSLTLFIASGVLFLLIILNLDQLYLLLPEEYRGGFTVVFIIGLIKVYDSLLGNNNSILYNSEYYRAVLVMGILLAVITILFNLWLIPRYGLEGAAIASFLAFFIYNTVKLIYVKVKFGMLPFTTSTLKVLGVLLLIGIPFYFLNFTWHPIINIILKGTLMAVLFGFAIYVFKISADVNGVIDKLIKRS
ncbi:polysaccharide biosynthesis C-terminal domain-containing protein [Maribacter sp. 2308TA10-17]|uniref:oligosaccharide flippase family protein n=1 Tax=Maribacter sp. 2308TA10-17 TaxID=3386276 RepID=UPI0039BC67B4